MSTPDSRYLRELHLLEQLVRTQHPQTLSQLSHRLGIPKSSLMRILDALMAAQFVMLAPGEQGYLAGPRANHLALGILKTPHFSRQARAILARLVNSTGESCNLTALNGDHMRYLERVETSHPLRLTMAVGARVPLHCTATGKLALALMAPEQCQQTLARIRLTAHTPRSFTDLPALERDLMRIRASHIGVDREEFVLGMVAVAVPVLDDRGRMLAALASHGPTARVSLGFLMEQIPQLQEAARQTAALFCQNAQTLSSPVESTPC